MALSLKVSAKGNTDSDLDEVLQRAYLELIEGGVSETYDDDDKSFTFELSGEED